MVLLIALLAGAVYTTFPRNYTAEGRIRIQPGESSIYRLSPLSSLIGGASSDIIASEVTIVQSRTLYLRVAKELNLVNDPVFMGTKHVKPQTLDDPKVRETVYRKLKAKIKVAHNPKDEIIEITCTTNSPGLSARIVNTLINDYVAYLFELRYGSTARASKWLIGQLGDLKQQIEQDQTALIDLQGRLGVVGFDDKNANYLYAQSLDTLTKAANDATIERIVSEAKYRFLHDSDQNLIEGEINLLSPPIVGQASLLQNLRDSEAQIASSYARQLSQFGPNYPDVKQQRAQLDEITAEVKAEERRILNQAQLSYNAATANEKMTKDTLEREKTVAFSSHDTMVRYLLLLHDYEAHRTLYEGLIQRLQEATITSGLEAGEIDIVDLADIPALPIPPGPSLIAIGSLVAGLSVGCVLALVFAALDLHISGPEQVTQMTGLSMLAQIPHVKFVDAKEGGAKTGSMMMPSRRSHYGESMQSLRTALLLAKPGSAPKVILITSATPGEGKSTTAVNLAATFALHNDRVLLCDCDMRKGILAKRLRLSAAKGLSSVLTRQVSLDTAFQEFPGVDGLFVLVDGPRPPDPAVLVGSVEMQNVINACREQFDFVILDSPPILGVSDALNLAQLVDLVVLMVRDNVSNKRAVWDSANMMAASHFPMAGFVINDVDPRAYSYGYGYRYSKYYKGYYTADAEDRK